jgi:hypothetical protein
VTPIQNNGRNYISEYFVYISIFIKLFSGYQQYVADGLKIDVSEALSVHSTADIYSMRALILKFQNFWNTKFHTGRSFSRPVARP